MLGEAAWIDGKDAGKNPAGCIGCILTNDRLMQAEGIKTCIVPVGYPEFSQTILEFEMMKVTSDKGCENLIDIAPTKLA